jgi:hypothetical protein
MAKFYVKEAVRKVSPGRPFSRDNGNELIAELIQHLPNPGDANHFRVQIHNAIQSA